MSMMEWSGTQSIHGFAHQGWNSGYKMGGGTQYNINLLCNLYRNYLIVYRYGTGWAT